MRGHVPLCEALGQNEIAQVVREYLELRTMSEIGRRLGADRRHVHALLVHEQVPIRTRGEQVVRPGVPRRCRGKDNRGQDCPNMIQSVGPHHRMCPRCRRRTYAD